MNNSAHSKRFSKNEQMIQHLAITLGFLLGYSKSVHAFHNMYNLSSNKNVCHPSAENNHCEADGEAGAALHALAIGGGFGLNEVGGGQGGNGENAEPEITSTDKHTVETGDSDVSTVTAEDADAFPHPLSYSISGGVDSGLFTIDPETGELKFATAPDVFDPMDDDGDNTYEVEVTVSDGLDSDTQSIEVDVVCNLEVDTTNDGTGIHSLRDAIICANENDNGHDTIMLEAGTYKLNVSGEDSQAEVGDLDIREDLTIIGDGIDSTIIDADFLDRVFQVHSGHTLTLEDLTVKDGANGSILLTNSHLVLNNVKIVDASGDSAVIATYDSTVDINSSLFDDNDADGNNGGALRLADNSRATIDDSTFTDNSGDLGGAISNESGYDDADSLVITNSIFEDNSASGSGGALFNTGATTINLSTFTENSGSLGGAIRSAGKTTLNEVTLNTNTADAGGGIFNSSELTLNDSTIHNNTATESAGGGLYTVDDSVVMSNNSHFTFNTATADTPTSWGGGIYLRNNSDVTLTDSEVSGNRADQGGGIYANEGTTLTLMNTDILTNQSANGGGGIRSAGSDEDNVTLTITDSLIQRNTSGNLDDFFNQGGGINANDSQIDITNTIITENTAINGNGGGIDIASSALNILNSDITYNIALGPGAGAGGDSGGLGLFQNESIEIIGTNIAYNTAQISGAGINWIPLATDDPTFHRIWDSTIHHNTAGDTGGGIYMFNVSGETSNIFQVINSTISNNMAGNQGGAISIPSDTAAMIIELFNSTVVENTADFDSGINNDQGDSVVRMWSTIVAQNSGNMDLDGIIDVNSHNLIGNDDGRDGGATGGSNILGTSGSPEDPELGPLADNGGQTLTHAVLPGSQVIDAGTNSLLGLEFDQRGFARLDDLPFVTNADDGTDIGAYELIIF